MGAETGMDSERRQRRMAAALSIADKMQATKRFDPPPASEAGAWAWGVYDVEDSAGRIIERGRSVWHRKDLVDEWNRLRLTDAGEP